MATMIPVAAPTLRKGFLTVNYQSGLAVIYQKVFFRCDNCEGAPLSPHRTRSNSPCREMDEVFPPEDS